MAANPPKVTYPPGIKAISDDLSTDDLVRRLKECAQTFQNLSQDEDNSAYVQLALHLAGEGFLNHNSKDVRLLVACCIADVFRVFAPEAPYKDPEQLKTIFLFFIEQLRGLEDPKDPTFKRYFYLLENLAWVKSFNICIELEDNQAIFCQLFSLIFTIVNDNHSNKVKNFMLDMMCPLITEADTVSQGLLDIVLKQIIEPCKTQNKNAYNLAKDVLKRTLNTIEPYIQSFFNNALVLGRTSNSTVAPQLYELIYELNILCPSMLIAVLPQLEFKLKCNDEKERLSVTKLLARMFSDKNSDLAAQNPPLWNCFLGRFNDISEHVRMRCVQYSMHFLLNHPKLRNDITESLRQRQHDPAESVRYEVVMAIISAAKKDFGSVTEELLNFVKERTLDKKFKIRKEALMGLAHLYKQHMSSPDLPASTLECISWIKNKVLHVYYQTALEDRLLVERILHTCLVPYQLPVEERMHKLYQLFATVDDHAVKAFNELLKCQCAVRQQMRAVLEALHLPAGEERERQLLARVALLSRNLPDSVKAQEYLMKFCALLEGNQRLRIHMNNVLHGGASCVEAERSVKEVLKSLGYPVQTNSFYVIIKQLLERVAPVMVDSAGVKQILSYVRDSLLGQGDVDIQMGVTNSALRGLQLLHVLASAFPTAFIGEEVYSQLLSFLNSDDNAASEMTLQIFTFVGADIDQRFPNVAQRLLPVVQNFVENGTVKQAKYAVACLNVIVGNKERVFGQVIDHLKQHFTLESAYFRTALVSIGHIALLCPDMFGSQVKSIVSKVVVKDLLMADREEPRISETSWCEFDALPEETKVKVEGMKMMVRWLVGLRTASASASSTLRLLVTVISHGGDLMEKEHVSAMERSWLRYMAAACMLKICCCPPYADALSHEQFQKLALVLQDECPEVREQFGQKLHKHLLAMRLPLQFLAIFALGGVEKRRPLRNQLRQWLLSCINKRRDFLKQHTINSMKLITILPDYVIPYAIHLLAHDPCLPKYDDVPGLVQIKECLWFLMEPLITKNEGYSFSFFKRLIENIKQTRDNQCPNDKQAQLKLYAVCDLALGLVMTKTTSFVLKDFPQEPVLPSKWYTLPDKVQVPNMKSYLPPELAFSAPKNTGVDLATFGRTRPRGALRKVSRRPRPVASGNVQLVQVAEVAQVEEEEVVDDVMAVEEEPSPGIEASSAEEGSNSPSSAQVINLRALRPTRRDRAALSEQQPSESNQSKRSRLEPGPEDEAENSSDQLSAQVGNAMEEEAQRSESRGTTGPVANWQRKHQP
ncbi:LOW QUALITY PROTEIN: sister chromatid cohesion protein PDS5 homolog B-like [Rhipicephalus sanguineus]|uniref:LOW QUALITY PROTEIN: sister chromatid cohesion protein PDS5 homolog B-like n=1 Tax=Rhipicephalus sanguineus TaxID=34632 RepID=UPI001894198C|nr:LOW QUALITY PROTEIN: sister chromatid cohesion protein PDS5 homolog B-like [Rhipicephalus sanguineus]